MVGINSKNAPSFTSKVGLDLIFISNVKCTEERKKQAKEAEWMEEELRRLEKWERKK